MQHATLINAFQLDVYVSNCAPANLNWAKTQLPLLDSFLFKIWLLTHFLNAIKIKLDEKKPTSDSSEMIVTICVFIFSTASLCYIRNGNVIIIHFTKSGNFQLDFTAKNFKIACLTLCSLDIPIKCNKYHLIIKDEEKVQRRIVSYCTNCYCVSVMVVCDSVWTVTQSASVLSIELNWIQWKIVLRKCAHTHPHIHNAIDNKHINSTGVYLFLFFTYHFHFDCFFSLFGNWNSSCNCCVQLF